MMPTSVLILSAPALRAAESFANSGSVDVGVDPRQELKVGSFSSQHISDIVFLHLIPRFFLTIHAAHPEGEAVMLYLIRYAEASEEVVQLVAG